MQITYTEQDAALEINNNQCEQILPLIPKYFSEISKIIDKQKYFFQCLLDP